MGERQTPLTETQEILLLGLTGPEIESLTAFARLHKHTLEEEVRLAIRVHLRRMVLSYVTHPKRREELISLGYDADEQEAASRRTLERLEAEAYRLPDEAGRRLRPHDHLLIGR